MDQLKQSSSNTKREIAFFKLGGTWDMVKKDGKMIGSGGLDDEALISLEKSLGFYTQKQSNIAVLEVELLKRVEESIRESSETKYDLSEHLPWVPHVNDIVTGKFISLFSGDSSHLRASLIAPLTSFLLRYANEHPALQILGAQGTDTADIALLALLDAYIFDTELLPFLITGANRSHHEWNSDAPKNFSDTFQLVGAHIPSGAYWVFASHLYRASDLIKIDPLETRRIENYSTFFAPRLTARYTRKVIGENGIFHPTAGVTAPKNHISQKVTAESLYKSLIAVDIVDLGDMNSTSEEIERIKNPKAKAVIIAAHSLGNASNPIKYACIEAANTGKIVVIVSRSLLGDVNERYAASLLSVNTTHLMGTGKQILTGHKMNKNIAKAIVTRALEEGLNQLKTQELINAYCDSRSLLH